MISHEEKENEIAPNLHIICGKISCLMCERIALSEFEIIRNEMFSSADVSKLS